MTPSTTEGTKVDIRLSNVDEMRDHATALFREHWEEFTSRKDLMGLEPNWKSYYELEERGLLIILAAWSADALVGYCVNILTTHTHHANFLYCLNDLLFVSREHRGVRGGSIMHLLIAETERLARDYGARMMAWHVTPGSSMGALMPKLGYEEQHTTVSKEL